MGSFRSQRVKRFTNLLFLTFILNFLAVIASISIGSSFIDPIYVIKFITGLGGDHTKNLIIFEVRYPRIVAAGITGALLALSGLLMQASTLNPLADPYLMGVASGALLGVTILLVVGGSPLGIYGLMGAAFMGSSLSLTILFTLLRVLKLSSPLALALIGISMSMAFHSLSTIMLFILGERSFSVIVWSFGSLALSSWNSIFVILPTLIFSFIVTLTIYKGLNAMLLGDESATSLGFRPQSYRWISVLIASFATSVVVAEFGVIGFVGLIAPHLARLWLRSGDHLIVLPISCALGSTLTLTGDLIARTIVAPGEVPITSVMSLIGVPVLLWLMVKKSWSNWK